MKIIISGGWSYGNIGDEVIADATIQLFSKTFPKVRIIYTSYNPDDFESIHNKKAFDSVHKIIEKEINKISDYKKIVDNLEEYGLEEYAKMFDKDTIFVMSGGGYFSESWISQFVARIIELYIASINGAKIIVIGQSIGPVYSNLGKELLVKMLNKCDYLSVRDKTTKEFLESLNLKSKLDCTPDLAITISDYIEKSLVKEKYLNIMPAAYSSYRSIKSKKKIKIIEKIRKRYSISGIKYKNEWKKLVKELSKEYKIKFVMSVNWKWDKDFVNYLTDNGKLENYEIVNCKTAKEMCQHLSMGKIIISTKMHPIIVSISYGIPAIAVSYDFKVDDFMKSISKSNCCFRNNKINSNEIEKLVKIYTNNEKNIDFDCDNKKKQVYEMMEKIKIIFLDLES